MMGNLTRLGRFGRCKGVVVAREFKVRRNDPCPCGSGKKYKKCYGRHASVYSEARADFHR